MVMDLLQFAGTPPSGVLYRMPPHSVWTAIVLTNGVVGKSLQWAYNNSSDLVAFWGFHHAAGEDLSLYVPWDARGSIVRVTDPNIARVIFFKGYLYVNKVDGAGAAGTYTITAVVETSKCMLRHVTQEVTITADQSLVISANAGQYFHRVPSGIRQEPTWYMTNTYGVKILKVYCPADISGFTEVATGLELIIGNPPAFDYLPYTPIYTAAVGRPAYVYDGIPVGTVSTFGVSSAFEDAESSLVDVSLTQEASRQHYITTVVPSGHTVNIYKKVATDYYRIAKNVSSEFFYLELFDHAGADQYVQSTVSGILQYLYTYYNILDGTESAPSPLSEEIDVTSAIVGVTCPPSDDPQVTHAKVYRVGGTLLGLTEVGELEYTGFNETYVDGTPAIDVSGALLNSQLHTAPPEGLRFLKHVYGIFIGAVDDKFYFTLDIGNPNYWPSTYYINFDSDITGLAIAGSGILVFTKYKTYIITGTNASTFVKYVVSEDQGCISSDSIVERGSQVLFFSSDGLCTSSGTDVKVISRPKLGKLGYQTLGKAVIHDDVYHIIVQPKGILAFDFRYLPAFTWYDSGEPRFFHYDSLVVGEDKLYGSYGGVLEELFTGDKQEYTYKTGVLTEGSASMLKSYKSVYVASSLTAPVDQADASVISIYIDGELVVSRQLYPGTSHEIKIPQAKQQGYSMQYKIEGKSDIYEIEYKAMARQNGR